VLFSQIDIAVSSLFYSKESGFFFRDNSILLGFKYTAFNGGRLLAVLFLFAAIISLFIKKEVFGFSSKKWFFLLCCLVVGPALMANVVFKEHWGRARPRDTTLFGGEYKFSPATYITNQCDHNCSFVSGDASFGFFLTSFAYVVGRRRKKLVFWTGLGIGSLFAFARILLGAHFVSDIIFAFVLIMLTNIGVYASFYGTKKTIDNWKEIF